MFEAAFGLNSRPPPLPSQNLEFALFQMGVFDPISLCRGQCSSPHGSQNVPKHALTRGTSNCRTASFGKSHFAAATCASIEWHPQQLYPSLGKQHILISISFYFYVNISCHGPPSLAAFAAVVARQPAWNSHELAAGSL